MRTKNLNLKKKIAFIASVAMIATTASYLPAGVSATTLNMPAVAGTTVPETFTAAAAEANNTSAKAETFHAFVKVDGKYLAKKDNTAGEYGYKLFNSKTNLETGYKLVDAVKDLTFDDTNEYYVLNNKVRTVHAATTNAERANYDYASVQDGTVITLPYNSNANATYTIEFVAKKGATLQSDSQTEIEFKLDDHGMYKLPVTNKSVKCASDNSNWDNNDKVFKAATASGTYEEYNFSGLKFEMEQLQEKDTLSLKGDLSETGASVTTGKTGSHNPVELVDLNGGTAGGQNFTRVATNAAADAKKTFADSYKVTKVGDVYATVLTGTLDEEILPGETVTVKTGLYSSGWSRTGVDSKGEIALTMGGDGYAKSGLVSAAKSGSDTEYFIFVVKNPGDVLNNAATQKDAETAINFVTATNAALTGSLLTTNANAATQRNRVDKEVKSENIKGVNYKQFVTNYTVYNNDKSTGVTSAAPQKITLGQEAAISEADNVKYTFTETENAVAGTAGQYDVDDKWDVTATLNGNVVIGTVNVTLTATQATTPATQEDKETAIVTLAKAVQTGATGVDTFGKDIDDAVAAAQAKKPVFELPEATAIDVYMDGDENKKAADRTPAPSNGEIWWVKAIDGDAAAYKKVTANTTTLDTVAKIKDSVINAQTGTQFDTVVFTTDTAGNFDSPIIKVTQGASSYVRVNFTTEYEMDWSDGDDETNPGKADGTTTVSDFDITKPSDVEKKGFEFKGWQIGGRDVFKTTAGDTQLVRKTSAGSENIITPNATLEPVFDGLRYNVVLDANGGSIIAHNSTPALSGYKTFNGDSKPTIATFNNLQRKTDNTDITANFDDMTNGAVGVKEGYTFKGWSTKKDSTTVMDLDDFKDAFPGKNETLTLYAIYTADDAIGFTWKELNVDPSTGNVYSTDGLASEVDDDLGNGTDTWDAWDDNTPATFENAGDSMKTGVAGEKIGKLPTPLKKGYEFEGWYVKYVDPITATITANKVTEDTIINDDVFNRNPSTGAITDHAVTLYAKFVQKSYKINFDLNGGSWTDAKYDEEDSNKPVSYKYFDNEFKVYNAKGGMVFSTDPTDGHAAAFAANPHIGSNTFKEFKGWTIGTSTTKISSANLYSEIQKIVNTGDITVKANYANKTTTASNIYIDANGGAVYYATMNTTTNKPEAFDNDADHTNNGQNNAAVDFDVLDAGVSLDGGTANTNVAAVWTASTNKDTIVNVANKDQAIVVGRPGYTFTGWFSDKACTTPYTFAKYPAAGKEDVVYAGWKANTNAKYRLNYDLYSTDGSLVESDKNGKSLTGQNVDPDAEATAKGYSFYRTRTGVTGDTVDASKIKLTVKEGEGTTAVEKTYVYDTKLSDKADATAVIKSSFKNEELLKGNFVEDGATYANIYGRYVPEGTETPVEVNELGKATEVKGTANGDKVTISFKAADNAVKYQVCKIVNGKKYYTSKVDATSIDITPASVDYQVYVIAFDKDGKSTHSETIKLTGVKKYNLGTVMDPVATEKLEADGTKTVTISWSKAENAAWYKVFKIVNGKKYWGKKVTETSYVLKNIPATDSYIVYVAAGDDKGHVTYGARKKVSKYPSVTNVTLAPDKKTVTFDAAEGAVKYQVAKIEENNKVNYSAKSTTTSITLKNAFKAGQKYYVLAFFEKDGKTYSSYSDTFEVK